MKPCEYCHQPSRQYKVITHVIIVERLDPCVMAKVLVQFFVVEEKHLINFFNHDFKMFNLLWSKSNLK